MSLVCQFSLPLARMTGSPVLNLSTFWLIKDDIKCILNSASFFCGEMDGSEARKTKEEKELVFSKLVIKGQPVELLLKCQKMSDFGGVDAGANKSAFDDAFCGKDYALAEERFEKLLIGVCADEASVNMG